MRFGLTRAFGRNSIPLAALGVAVVWLGIALGIEFIVTIGALCGTPLMGGATAGCMIIVYVARVLPPLLFHNGPLGWLAAFLLWALASHLANPDQPAREMAAPRQDAQRLSALFDEF